MGQQASFHAPHGGADVLAWRRRGAAMEIVYDDGVARHLVLRLAGAASVDASAEARLSDALRRAVMQPHILAALYGELRKRAIAFELVKG